MGRAEDFHQAAQVVAAMKREPESKIEVEHEEFGTVLQWVLSEDDREFVAFAGVWAEARVNRSKVLPEDFYIGMPSEDEDSILLANMSLEERQTNFPKWGAELEGYWDEIRNMSTNIFYGVAETESE